MSRPLLFTLSFEGRRALFEPMLRSGNNLTRNPALLTYTHASKAVTDGIHKSNEAIDDEITAALRTIARHHRIRSGPEARPTLHSERHPPRTDRKSVV